MRIWLALGDAKIVPATPAVRSPRPTKPAKEGSWPEPPPEMRLTVEGVGVDWYIILLGASREMLGFARVRECSAVLTRTVGSLKKCLALGFC